MDHRSLKQKSAKSMSLTGFEKISKSLEVGETWMLFELY